MAKQPGSEKKHAHGGIAWNEENLAENERIKATLKPVKINEPKTPFHELLPDDDIDLEPLALDGNANLAAAAPAVQPVKKKSARLSSARIRPPSREQDGDDASKFDDARRSHYNMKELLSNKHMHDEEDDEDDEEEEEEAGSAGAKK